MAGVVEQLLLAETIIVTCIICMSDLEVYKLYPCQFNAVTCPGRFCLGNIAVTNHGRDFWMAIPNGPENGFRGLCSPFLLYETLLSLSARRIMAPFL